jgi:hypothetical protein
MAISVTNPILAKQKARGESRKPHIQAGLKLLFAHLAQHGGNPDLQFVAIDTLDGTSSVIADAACKLRALYLKKPAGSTTSAFIKASDTAVTASATAPALSIELPTNNEEILLFPNGLPFGTGITMLSNTTATDTTASAAADQASGFAIISAP